MNQPPPPDDPLGRTCSRRSARTLRHWITSCTTTPPPRWERDGVVQRAFSAYQQAAGEAHSRFADPLFVDAAQGDYRLKPGSPAIGMADDGGTVGAFPDVPKSEQRRDAKGAE